MSRRMRASIFRALHHPYEHCYPVRPAGPKTASTLGGEGPGSPISVFAAQRWRSSKPFRLVDRFPYGGMTYATYWMPDDVLTRSTTPGVSISCASPGQVVHQAWSTSRL